MVESPSNGQKMQGEKEKLLVTSNFSFPHSVFKGLVQPGLIWERVNQPHTFYEL